MLDKSDAILEKEAQSGRESLTTDELRIFHIYRFISLYENGGLSGFLYNTDFSVEEVNSLIEAIGSQDKGLVRSLSDLIRIIAVPTEFESGSLDDLLAIIDPTDKINDIDSDIFKTYETLWEQLEELSN